MIKADYIDNTIQGIISCKRKNRPINFEMKPVSVRREANIIGELKRLYFDSITKKTEFNSIEHQLRWGYKQKKLMELPSFQFANLVKNR